MHDEAGGTVGPDAPVDLNALDSHDALARTLQRLWPRGVVTPGRRRAHQGTAEALSAEQWFVPNARSPRLTVPAHPASAARGMCRFSDAVPVGEVLRRLGIAAGLRVFGGWLLPDRITITGDEGLPGHLEMVFGRPVTIGVSIGSARANRKPVLGVFDRHGRQIAFVKVGDNEVTTRLVTDEAEALGRLAEHSFETFAAPAVIAFHDWSDLRLLIMTALPTSPWRSPLTRGRPPIEAMTELATGFDEGLVPVVGTPLWKRALVARDALRDHGLAERYEAALETIAARWGQTDVRVGAWHGDFTPWNMARRRGVVQLWDWERFETGVPAGFDMAHWSVQTDGRARAGDADAMCAALDRSGLEPIAAVTYLSAIAGRYLVAAQEHHGEAIAPQASGAVAALEQFVGSRL